MREVSDKNLMFQCGFVNYNKYPPLVEDVDNARSKAEYIQKILTSTQLSNEL